MKLKRVWMHESFSNFQKSSQIIARTVNLIHEHPDCLKLNRKEKKWSVWTVKLTAWLMRTPKPWNSREREPIKHSKTPRTQKCSSQTNTFPRSQPWIQNRQWLDKDVWTIQKILYLFFRKWAVMEATMKLLQARWMFEWFCLELPGLDNHDELKSRLIH